MKHTKSDPAKLSVVHLVTSLKQGGAERQLSTIVNHSNTIKNTIYSFYRVESSYLKEPGKVLVFRRKHLFGKILELRGMLRRNRPDVIFAWGALPYLLAYLAVLGRNPKIINGSIRHGVFKKSISGYFRMFLLHTGKYVVANSAAGLSANRLNRGFILYNGIDPKFDRNIWAVSDKKRKESLEISLISVANLIPYKDYLTIFKALKALKDENYNFVYRIIGEGPSREMLEADVFEKELTDNVIFLGRVSNPEEYLAQSDIFIHSSKGEGCSNAILEAMYMGLPIIASDTGGTPEIVGDNAILFRYQNVTELHDALKKVTDDENLREMMAEKSYEIASSRFSVSRMLTDYQDIIQKIANK